MKVNQDTYAQVFKHLLENEADCNELANITGLHIITVRSLMKTLKKHKVVHIVAWNQDAVGREVIPIYKLGTGKDKKRVTLTPAEKMVRYRAKKKGMLMTNALFGGVHMAGLDKLKIR